MYFFEVQAAMTDQFAVKQQHRHLVPIARPSGLIAIDIDHIDARRRGRRQRRKGAQHLLTETATVTGIEQEASRRHVAFLGQWRGSSPPPDIFTEWAMNSTVCAGTSPTAVTW